jgi:hypothetical protein
MCQDASRDCDHEEARGEGCLDKKCKEAECKKDEECSDNPNGIVCDKNRMCSCMRAETDCAHEKANGESCIEKKM